MKKIAICTLMGALFAGCALSFAQTVQCQPWEAPSRTAAEPWFQQATVTATKIDTGVASKAKTNNSGVCMIFPVFKKAITGLQRK